MSGVKAFPTSDPPGSFVSDFFVLFCKKQKKMLLWCASVTCYKKDVSFFSCRIEETHLKEEVDEVRVLLQFGTDYTQELNLLIFCRSSQHLPTQPYQFLCKESHDVMGKNPQSKSSAF